MINAQACVVRMWDCQWQTEVDYGSRYDYGLIEVHKGVMDKFWAHNARQPAIGWIASTMDKGPIPLPSPVELLSQQQWVEAGSRAGVNGRGERGKWELTRGTIAACWAIERAAAGDEVILVGFDNVRAGRCLTMHDGFPKAYRGAPTTFTFKGYKEGEVRYGYHDFSAEWPLLRLLAERREVHVAFSDEVWV